jgi:hypothetical protein
MAGTIFARADTLGKTRTAASVQATLQRRQVGARAQYALDLVPLAIRKIG